MTSYGSINFLMVELGYLALFIIFDLNFVKKKVADFSVEKTKQFNSIRLYFSHTKLLTFCIEYLVLWLSLNNNSLALSVFLI